MTPSEMKTELERIWREEPLAHIGHVTGWLTPELAIKHRKGYRIDKRLSKVKGKPLTMKPKRKKKCPKA